MLDDCDSGQYTIPFIKKEGEGKKGKQTEMLLVQHIMLYWEKNCRGGLGAVQRSKFPQAAKLPANFFDYISFGSPIHQVLMKQKTDGFDTQVDCRRIGEFGIKNSRCISPMELIPKENDCYEIRYRYDWHKGALPQRYQYNQDGNYTPLNELAFELFPNTYGRAICNGRFVDWDTGNWWYELTITNVIVLAESKAPLTCFLINVPTHYYQQIAHLW